MDVAPAFTNESTSGEVRLSRLFTHGAISNNSSSPSAAAPWSGSLAATRSPTYGSIPLTSQAQFPQPDLSFTPLNHDSTRQLDSGA